MSDLKKDSTKTNPVDSNITCHLILPDQGFQKDTSLDSDSVSPVDVQIMLVSGLNEPDRCTAGLLMAVTCATSFKKTVVFLMMNASELAAKQIRKKVKVEPFDYIDQYINYLLALGVKIEVCSTCIKKFFPNLDMENPSEFIRPEIQITGMIEVAFRANTARTLMF